MFGMLRLARRIAENPKLLIALVVLIAFGLFLDFVVLGGGSDNPLPELEDVQQVSFIGSSSTRLSPQPVDRKLYRQLCQCLDESEQVITSGGGPLAGTLLVRQTDGSTVQAKLYEYGLVETDDGQFATEGALSNKVCSLISQIRRQAG